MTGLYYYNARYYEPSSSFVETLMPLEDKTFLFAWLAWSGFGVACGLICAWLWAFGAIVSSREYQKGRMTTWMMVLTGRSKPVDPFPRNPKPVRTFYRALSAGGVIAGMLFYHYMAWPELSQGKGYAFLFETSYPLSILGTWGFIAWKIETIMKRRPPT